MPKSFPTILILTRFPKKKKIPRHIRNAKNNFFTCGILFNPFCNWAFVHSAFRHCSSLTTRMFNFSLALPLQACTRTAREQSTYLFRDATARNQGIKENLTTICLEAESFLSFFLFLSRRYDRQLIVSHRDVLLVSTPLSPHQVPIALYASFCRLFITPTPSTSCLTRFEDTDSISVSLHGIDQAIVDSWIFLKSSRLISTYSIK